MQQAASRESLVLQQIVHYLTTYGFEAHGIYQEETVYIPHEILELPAIGEDVPLVIVRAMGADALLAAIVDLGSGIALSPETLADIMTIVQANAFDSAFAEQIGNRLPLQVSVPGLEVDFPRQGILQSLAEAGTEAAPPFTRGLPQ